MAVDNFDFTRKIVEIILAKKFVKIQRFCSICLLTKLISREKLKIAHFTRNVIKGDFFRNFKHCEGFVSKKRMKNNHAPPVKVKDDWYSAC